MAFEPGEHRGDIDGKLQKIKGCWLKIPGSLTTGGKHYFRSLPEITDSKSANYNSQTIFGRASPIRSFSDSAPRTISISWDMYNVDQLARDATYEMIRAISSAVYPIYEPPYNPPPICQFQCGSILAGKHQEDRMAMDCLIMSYNFSYGKDSIMDDYMMPFHISASLDLEVIYSSKDLPGQDAIIQEGV